MTAVSDSYGNLYMWILSDRAHYQDMINGVISIQVEEGETPTDFIEHKYKSIEVTSDPQEITMYSNIENVIEDKEGNSFILTYSGEKLQTKIEKTFEERFADLEARLSKLEA